MTQENDFCGPVITTPPKDVSFPVYHPNIDGMGDICIPILCFDNWKPATTLEDIMTSLIQILAEPDLSRPICQDIMEEYVKHALTIKGSSNSRTLVAMFLSSKAALTV
ncbi:ubiquitin--protein ligase [Oesophagostomum dentatum]|uniref:Ubiquitin--protein ligase n=1 Tax=Oesophagostomum dentatum TaxID=61180 RepID=A0A0B1TCT7_OESDE|nr:ubiquitin--protein ligase [Oesophagostomum dentatum]